MSEIWRRLISSEYMPHGHCYLWEPPLVALEVITNLSIGLAYLSISLTLAYFAHRTRNLPFRWVYLAFGTFIVACGFTHFMDVWVIWRPNYWFDVAVRVVCASASVGTAVLIWPLVPKAAALADTARLADARGTKLEELNAELAALYEKSRETLAEAIPHLVWTATPDGAADYFNQRWIDYTGIQGLGWAWQEAIEPEDLKELLARWKESVSTGEPYEVLCRHRRRDGEYRWFLVRALPLRSGDRIVRWFGTCTDVHDQRLLAQEREQALERAREEVRTRDVFLAIAAHELRTPLTPLRLEIEGLEKAREAGVLTSDGLEGRLSVALRQIGRLERLVANLLDVSRLTTGRFTLDLEPTDIAALIREVAARHTRELRAAGCDLGVHANVSGPIMGEWDRLRLDEVVTNLLGNAIRYGRGQPISIDITATEATVRFDVSDRGTGIAPEDHARIFERFERATAERHAGGLGLGLWLVRAIVEAHGGSVGVKSALGEGSRFTVELPRRSESPQG